MKKTMNPAGCTFIIDSLWSGDRINRRREGRPIRRLKNGTEFEIYKRYFSENEIEKLGDRYGYKTTVKYVGKTMFLIALEPS